MSYDWIRASELNSYAFCSRAWWLRRVRKVLPQNKVELAAGRAYHEQHGRAVLRALRQRRLALFLFFASVALLTFYLVGG